MRARTSIVHLAVLGVLLSATVVAAPAVRALPHGCASASRDYQAWADPRAREVGVRVNSGEPCTFRFAEGDTFSGSGRFSVVCATGGRLDHRDLEHDPPVFNAPIPQPCAVGALVTLDGNHAMTGGAVIGGGRGTLPDLPQPRSPEAGLEGRCAGNSGRAQVALEPPVARSGLYTYRGTVRCDRATVRITSLTITHTGGYPFPPAGTAECTNCDDEISVAGTIPGRVGSYEVRMTFEIHTQGQPPLTGSRLGRYVAHWGGTMFDLCPRVRPAIPSDADSIEIRALADCPV